MQSIVQSSPTGDTKQNPVRITLLLFGCALAVVSSLYVSIPLLPLLEEDFHASPAGAAWAGSAFSFCYAAGFLLFGPLSERFGRKRVMVAGLGALSLVSLLLGFAASLPPFIALRAVQGAAAASFAPAALAYVGETFPAERRVAATGIISTGFLLSGIIGQATGSLVGGLAGWHSVFFLFGGLYLISSLLVLRLLPQEPSVHRKTGILSSFTPIAALLANKRLRLAYTVTVTLLLAFVGMYTALGSYLSGPAYKLDSGSILLVRSLGIVGMLLAPLAGRMTARFGIHRVLRGGLLTATLGLIALGLSSSLPALTGTSIVFVAGISVTVPTLVSLIGQIGSAARGTAVALYMFILILGATLGPIVSVALLQWTGSHTGTFEALALVIGMGAAASFFIRR